MYKSGNYNSPKWMRSQPVCSSLRAFVCLFGACAPSNVMTAGDDASTIVLIRWPCPRVLSAYVYICCRMRPTRRVRREQQVTGWVILLESVLIVAHKLFAFMKRTQFIGKDSFRIFPNCRYDRIWALVLRIRRITAFRNRAYHGMLSKARKGRKFRVKTKEATKKGLTKGHTFQFDEWNAIRTVHFAHVQKTVPNGSFQDY